MRTIEMEVLSQKVADAISERIIRRKILPGERLVETKVANDLGVSQGTVREALRILEKKKLIVIHKQRGTFVTQIDSTYIESLYDILSRLYVLMIRKFIKKATDDDFQAIERIMEKIKSFAKAQNALGFFEGCFEALALELRIAGDPLLERTIKELWLLQRWSGNEARILYQKQLLSYYKMQCEIFALMKNSKTGEAIKKLREIVKFEKDIAMKALKD